MRCRRLPQAICRRECFLCLDQLPTICAHIKSYICVPFSSHRALPAIGASTPASDHTTAAMPGVPRGQCAQPRFGWMNGDSVAIPCADTDPSFCRKNAMVQHQRTTHHHHGFHFSGMDSIDGTDDIPESESGGSATWSPNPNIMPGSMQGAMPNTMPRVITNAPTGYLHPIMDHQYVLQSQQYNRSNLDAIPNTTSIVRFAPDYMETPHGGAVVSPVRSAIDVPPSFQAMPHTMPSSMPSSMQSSPTDYSVPPAPFSNMRYFTQAPPLMAPYPAYWA